jgi:glucosamine kinase
MIALGIDAGGTTTRWLLLSSDRRVLAEGHVVGLSALLLHSDHGQAKLRAAFAQIANELKPARENEQASGAANVMRVCAGFTGIDGHSDELAALIAHALALDASQVTTMSDIEVAYRGAFAPSEGYIVYAGTGSIACFIDANNVFQRAGGRGVGLDDGGGGYWMAREALRHLWRREDERPGAWQDSPLAHAVFKRIGGSDWDASRKFFYTQERGEIGTLALAVAETADADPVSREILRGAGIELARLGAAMIVRYGARPIALAGRAAKLHSIIEVTIRERLPSASISFIETAAQRTAAEFALANAR